MYNILYIIILYINTIQYDSYCVVGTTKKELSRRVAYNHHSETRLNFSKCQWGYWLGKTKVKLNLNKLSD